MKALGYEKAHPVGEFALELIDAPGKTGHRPQDGRLAGVAALRLTIADPSVAPASHAPSPSAARSIRWTTPRTPRRTRRLSAWWPWPANACTFPGWTEISAVRSEPVYRGHRLGTRLLPAVAAGIRDRGEASLPNALESNVDAMRRYEYLGFRLRTKIAIVVQP
jgi:GNAT superfamily N-acetyltransferase